LEAQERNLPDVAIGMARHWLSKGGDGIRARGWLLPVWERMHKDPQALTSLQRSRLVRTLEGSMAAPLEPPELAWVARIEQTQLAAARDPLLQYLAGVMCMRLSLWGKAQHLLRQCVAISQEPDIKRDAQRALEQIAQRRDTP